MTSFAETFKAVKMNILRQAVPIVSSVAEQAERAVKEKTPIDTGNLIENIQVEWAVIEGDTIRARVFVDPKQVDYAVYVEWGGKGVKKNYYKGDRRSGGTPFYQAKDWAQMFTRTQIEATDNLVKALS